MTNSSAECRGGGYPSSVVWGRVVSGTKRVIPTGCDCRDEFAFSPRRRDCWQWVDSQQPGVASISAPESPFAVSYLRLERTARRRIAGPAGRAGHTQCACAQPGPGNSAGSAMAAAAEGVLATRREEPARDDAAVETAEEAKEPAEADITELCRDMFSKMATYLTGELTATSEDYKLLENMNKLTSLKYLEMKDIAINISRNLKDLNQKYAGLQPYLDQINVIEEQVAALEQAAYKLDAYSKKLEAKYKKLEKR
ncbi:biogenesis of lysosome-related organelles complex 1 subunit 2 [Cebus imitator]|nr:biogenesis of lysosome-related organelles complex 1 subunit 2 [Cebus imitator]